MAAEIIQPNPVPVSKDTLNPHQDFCATLVDYSLNARSVPITKLISISTENRDVSE